MERGGGRRGWNSLHYISRKSARAGCKYTYNLVGAPHERMSAKKLDTKIAPRLEYVHMEALRKGGAPTWGQENMI
jgi:hypothetical protein